MNPIPKMVHPLSKGWDQPNPDEFIWTGIIVYMSKWHFHELREYSSTFPSGVYAGKMWKAFLGGKWFLLWFTDINNDMCKVNKLPLLTY